LDPPSIRNSALSLKNVSKLQWLRLRVGVARAGSEWELSLVPSSLQSAARRVAATDIDERKRAEQKLQQENVALREEIDKASMFEEIVGTSKPLKAVLSRIAKVGPTDSTDLITRGNRHRQRAHRSSGSQTIQKIWSSLR
jgi:transcriptional regulator with AAA-type ATPase domain